jgi:transcriptional regulator of aromatic amino acid metabolism
MVIMVLYTKDGKLHQRNVVMAVQERYSQQPLGESEVFLDFQAKLSRVAAINRPVLLVGERGSGKRDRRSKASLPFPQMGQEPRHGELCRPSSLSD